MVELRAQLDQSTKDETQVKEGHLMQKASNNSWQKFWYVLKDGHLSCYKGKKDAASLVESLNVMYCSPKIPMGTEKLPQFQVATPSKKKPILLQAETPEERDSWMKAIQQAIEVQLNQNEPAVRVSQSDSLAFKILSSIDGNGFCADCCAPGWFSLFINYLLPSSPFPPPPLPFLLLPSFLSSLSLFSSICILYMSSFSPILTSHNMVANLPGMKTHSSFHLQCEFSSSLFSLFHFKKKMEIFGN